MLLVKGMDADLKELQIQVIYEIGQILGQAQNLDQALEFILGVLSKSLTLKYAGVTLKDPETGEYLDPSIDPLVAQLSAILMPGLAECWEAATDAVVCNSGERNIMVDLDGMAGLCFNKGFMRRKLSLRGDLKKFWDEADAARRNMIGCRTLCGIDDCVRRESQILGGDARFEGSGA